MNNDENGYYIFILKYLFIHKESINKVTTIITTTPITFLSF